MVLLLVSSGTVDVEAIRDAARNNPKNVRFADLAKLCEAHFGSPRTKRGSHLVYRMPWQGDPRVNLQNDKGKAKEYQVRQVLKAIDRLESQQGER